MLLNKNIYKTYMYNTIVCKTERKSTRVYLKRAHTEHLYIYLPVYIQLHTVMFWMGDICMYRRYQTLIDSRFFAIFTLKPSQIYFESDVVWLYMCMCWCVWMECVNGVCVCVCEGVLGVCVSSPTQFIGPERVREVSSLRSHAQRITRIKRALCNQPIFMQ